MSIKIGHANYGESGITNQIAGDASGREVCIRAWWNMGWNCVLRPKKAEIAELSAKCMEAICANNNIGYDQSQRNTLYTQAKAVNFDCSKIVVKCECDCSSAIHVAVIAAGANIAYGSNGFTTRTMVDKLVASGDYEKLTDTKYLTSDKYLKRGDILVNVGSHTVMALENGAGVTTSTTVSATSSAIAVGDVVSIAKGATYYNSTKKPGTWIINKNWVVKAVSGSRVVVDKSEDGKSSINSPIDAKYLTVVTSATTQASTTSVYYPKYTGTETSLDAILEAIGVPAQYRGDYSKRIPLAEKQGITNYKGTTTQNSKLKSLAKSGKLKRV